MTPVAWMVALKQPTLGAQEHFVGAAGDAGRKVAGTRPRTMADAGRADTMHWVVSYRVGFSCPPRIDEASVGRWTCPLPQGPHTAGAETAGTPDADALPTHPILPIRPCGRSNIYTMRHIGAAREARATESRCGQTLRRSDIASRASSMLKRQSPINVRERAGVRRRPPSRARYEWHPLPKTCLRAKQQRSRLASAALICGRCLAVTDDAARASAA